ncbi:MAG: HAD hydrolase-like protein [Candidatus Lokiarchaeota archaeon]|nr:HAD hydrolase-like protein [Candidatus Lokiarchaeota archaeon]
MLCGGYIMAILTKNTNIKNTKAIVFDWNGTLYNNVPVIKAAMRDVLEEYNIDYPVEEAVEKAFSIIKGIDNSNMSKVMLNAYKISEDIPFIKNLPYIDRLKMILKLYMNYKRYSQSSRLFSGAKEMVEMLSEKFDLALLATEDKQEIINMLKKYGLDNYFKSIVSCNELNQPKSPEAIQKALHELKYNPDEVVYVGDLHTDILAANQAKVNSIAISNGLISPEILTAEKPNVICNHVTDLSRIFDLPELKVDIELDQQIDLKTHEEKIKRIVHVDFDWVSLIKKALPEKLESDQVTKIIKDPFGFVGALLRDIINLYTEGEVELRQELEIFNNNCEDDLLKCLGLIIIHFVNERGNNIFEKISNSKILKPIFQIEYSLLTFYYMNSYPIESKIRFKRIFLRVFDRIIPDEVKLSLQQKTPDEFIEAIFEGSELALHDLGIKTVGFSRITNLLKIPLIPLNLSLGRVNDVLEYHFDTVKDIVDDILTHDFRKQPKVIEK